MLLLGSKVKVADNSGAKIAQCIKILKTSKRKAGSIGDLVIVSIKSLRKGKIRSKIEKGSIQKGIILRTKKTYSRKDGTKISFGENAITIFKKQGQPLSTRLFGPVLEDLRLVKDIKLISLSSSFI